MNYLIPKNWANFQHYKDRAPAWIKLHGDLLDDFEFHCLPLASKALAPLLWLLASKYEGGKIPLDYIKIAFRLRCEAKELESAVKSLILAGFFIVEGELEQPASTALAQCLPREREEKEREKEGEENTPAAPSKSPRATKQSDALRAADLIAIGVPEIVAIEYMAVRKRRRAGDLPRVTLESIRQEAASVGWSLEQALAKCITRNWVAFEAAWVGNDKPAFGQQSTSQTLADYNRQIAQEALADHGFFGDSNA